MHSSIWNCTCASAQLGCTCAVLTVAGESCADAAWQKGEPDKHSLARLSAGANCADAAWHSAAPAKLFPAAGLTVQAQPDSWAVLAQFTLAARRAGQTQPGLPRSQGKLQRRSPAAGPCLCSLPHSLAAGLPLFSWARPGLRASWAPGSSLGSIAGKAQWARCHRLALDHRLGLSTPALDQPEFLLVIICVRYLQLIRLCAVVIEYPLIEYH